MSKPNSRRRLNTLSLVLIICSVLLSCSKPDYHTADGGSGRFADLRGKWLFINYWAEWCKPCIEEMPELNNFQRQVAATATVLAVNYDGVDNEQLQRQIKKLHIEIPVLQQDPSAQLGYARPDGLPTTFVFDPEGKLAATLVGPQTAATLAAAMTPAPAAGSAP